MNIKTVLTFRFILIVALILGSFSILVYQFSADFRQRDYYHRLGTKLEGHIQIAHQQELGNTSRASIDALSDRYNLFKEEVMVFDHSRKLIYQSKALSELKDYPKDFSELDVNNEIESTNGKKELIARKQTIDGKTYYAWCSALDQHGFTKINFLRKTLLILFMVGILLTAITGWHFSKEALRPFSEVLSEVKNINANNLDTRLPEGNGKDEVAQLAITFNDMLRGLEEAFELQRGFVSNASHEFRTPLTAMKGQIEVTLFQERSIEYYETVLRSLNEDIDKLIELLRGLSQLASSSTARRKTESTICHLPQLALEAADMLKLKNPEYQIRLGSFDIPETDLWVSVEGSETLLRTSILNLLDNACKYSNDHTARITLGYRGDHAFVSIADNGAGIADEDLSRIFEPFYRSPDTRSKPGFGIGLSLVKKIVEQHNGWVELQPNTPQGSIFTIWIPHLFPTQMIE